MTLTPYGRREWLTITVVSFLLGAIAVAAGWWPVSVVVAIGWLATLWFFRDPKRHIDPSLAKGEMISPADGTVSAVTTVDHHEATDGPAVVVRIFLSVLNVHVNRAPYDGTVRAVRHSPGQFLNAQREDSARLNEANLITLENPDGERFGVRQVAGLIARRIVCPLTVGDTLKRGQKFGMIKFGSTTELILPRPSDVTVHVMVGDRVRGGLTKLATTARSGANTPG